MKSIDNNLLLFSFVHSYIPTSIQMIFLFIELTPIYLISFGRPIRLFTHFGSGQTNSQLSLLFKFRINTIVLDQPFSNTIAIVTISLIIVAYWLINYFQSKTTSLKVSNISWYNIIYTIIYDILIFRTSSFILIIILFNEFTSIFDISAINIILGIIIAVILVLYIFTLNHHISSYCVMFCFNNRGLIQITLNYPFDKNFSKLFDTLMIVYKIISALNNAFCLASTESEYDSIELFLNGIIAMLILSFYVFIFYNLFIFPSIEWFIFNRELNFFRLGFILMNFYSLVLSLLFLKPSSSNFLILIIMISSLIWALITLLYFWRKVFLVYLSDGKLTFKKVLICIMNNYPSRVLKINQPKLVNSIKNNCKLFLINNSITFSPMKSQKTFYLTDSNNKNDIELFQLFNFFRKFDSNFLLDSFDKKYSDIVCLFYYYYKGKVVKYFSYYNSIKRKYRNNYNIVNSVSLFVKISLSFFDVAIYSYISSDSVLNQNIINTLEVFKSLLTIPNEMIKPIMIFNLADKIHLLKKHSKKILLSKDIDENTYNAQTMNDYSLRLIRHQYKFFFVMRRYITESIINEPIDEINNFDIELNEDYLNNHYDADRILLMSIDLNRFSIKNDMNLFKIHKCGRELIAHLNLCLSGIFPKKFRYEGTKAFENKLQHYLESNISSNLNYNSNNNTFEYFISLNMEDYIESFKYNFNIIPSLNNNDLIISGLYSINESALMLFKENSVDGKLTIETFSDSLLNWFIITPEWIQYARSCDVHITMDNLFSKFDLIDKVDYECLFVQAAIGSLSSLFNYIENDNCYFSKKDYNDINDKLDKAKNSKMKSLKFLLQFQFDINSNNRTKYKLFSIVGLKNTSKNNNSLCTPSTNNIKEAETHDMFYFDNNAVTTQSNLSSSTGGSLTQTERKTKLLSKQDKQVSNITKTFSKFSLLILIFNSVIILICVIFMIIEINLSQKILVLSDIVCKFQGIRTNFGNTFLNIFSNICLAKDIETGHCENSLSWFSKILVKEQNLDPRYSMRDLMIQALKYKIVKLQKQTQTYKNIIFQLGDSELEDILKEKMQYAILSVKNNKIIQTDTTITFEEGIQNFINSAAKLDKAPDNFDNPKYCLYIITASDIKTNFGYKINVQSLNEIQLEIYILLINFLNYTWGYINGENLLYEAFNKTKSLNQTVLYSYIALIIGLHIILAFLCKYIIIIVKRLLQSFLQQISRLLMRKETKKYFIKKIDNLILLNNLYSKNPNNIIKQMQKDQKKAIMKIMIKQNQRIQAIKNNMNGNSIKNSKEEIDALLFGSDVDCFIDEKEFNVVIKPFIMRTKLLFSIFFLSALLFDFVLLYSFSIVILTYNYLQANIGIENQMYLTVAYHQIVGLLNLTQAELAKELRLDTYDEVDGVLNMKIREGIAFREAFFKQEKEHPNLFPLIDTYFGKTCELIYNQTRDDLVTDLSIELDLDYVFFQIEMCKRYKITTLENFEYMYFDHNFRSHALQNYFDTLTYQDLFKYNTHIEFSELYTFTMITVRPLRTYISEKIIYHQMDSVLYSFINTIIGFLFFNIFADILLFIIIKVFILRGMNMLHQNLIHLSKCLNIELSGAL